MKILQSKEEDNTTTTTVQNIMNTVQQTFLQEFFGNSGQADEHLQLIQLKYSACGGKYSCFSHER
jgi:hypothetical protein